MSSVAEIRRQNLRRWVASPSELHQKAGKTFSYWSDLLRGPKSFGEKAARSIEEAMGWAPNALEDVNELRRPPLNPGAAHLLSLEEMQTVPSTTWEQIAMQSSGGTPRVFRLPVDSVEMEPRVKRGVWVQFASHLADDAKPGDGVLVRDSAGGLHFRVYRAGRPGTWEAHAENKNYEPLVSDRDGLNVIAVLTAVEGRWS